MLKVFVFAVIVGAFSYNFQPDLLENILKFFQDKFGGIESDQQLTSAIFIQNIESALFALIGGLILGIIPILFMATNGFLIGFVIVALFVLNDAPIIPKVIYTLAGLLPHGIFEIPAVLLAAAFGWNLGTRFLIRPQPGITRWQVFKQGIKETLLIIPLIVLLLAIAVVVEVYFTGYLVELCITYLNI
jgi:stage II sporulation protein M